jgi:hypothetical protein
MLLNDQYHQWSQENITTSSEVEDFSLARAGQRDLLQFLYILLISRPISMRRISDVPAPIS